MAVFCGVCAIRLYDATENGGSFRVGANFNGWDKRIVAGAGGRTKSQSVIRDTCDSCAAALRVAVGIAATTIAETHAERVAILAQEVAAEEERRRTLEQERQEFELMWRRSREATRRR